MALALLPSSVVMEVPPRPWEASGAQVLTLLQMDTAGVLGSGFLLAFGFEVLEFGIRVSLGLRVLRL